MALGAGSRRGLLKAAVCLLVALCAGCATGAERRRESILEPLFSIAGARLVTRVDIAGGSTADAIGAYVPLVFPVAVAASFNDIYIADAGTSRLYRYDRTLDAMAVMPVANISRATKLQVGPDGSIYVLDPFASEIRRYARSGKQLPAVRPRQATSRYDNFTVDSLTGKGYAVDSAHLVIDEIQPLGQFAIDFMRLDEAGPIATDGRGLFVASTRCGCVVEWIQGRQGRRFGSGKLRQPLSLGVDGPNVFVLDGFDRSIALVHEEGIEAMSAAALGMVTPESLAATGGMILIADGAGHRVSAFRVKSRRAR
ncbi:MAG: hypothetical protein A3H93_13325 [Rhodocyclales bacterium RIFCSPLOWO2_02_FULL_63_24]|nr:MAG: hypothetical protein A3H93_13325 [Rhodocyclales bacterium RIFCSPLOWO2_02_FULL_63_24]